MNKLYEYYPNGWVNLMKLTGYNVNEMFSIINSLGIKCNTHNTFLAWRNSGSMHPEDIISICNHFRFPISNFILINDNKPNDSDCRLFSKEEWEDITLHLSNIIAYCTDKHHLIREKSIELIDCSPNSYDALRKYPAKKMPRLTFKKLLFYLSNVKIHIGDVFIDHNASFLNIEKITPYYDEYAKQAFYEAFKPEPQVSNVAENIFDVFQFVRQYFNSESLLGDNNIYHITGKTMNEIGSAQNKLYRENVELKSKISILEKEIERLIKKRD